MLVKNQHQQEEGLSLLAPMHLCWCLSLLAAIPPLPGLYHPFQATNQVWSQGYCVIVLPACGHLANKPLWFFFHGWMWQPLLQPHAKQVRGRWPHLVGFPQQLPLKCFFGHLNSRLHQTPSPAKSHFSIAGNPGCQSVCSLPPHNPIPRRSVFPIPRAGEACRRCQFSSVDTELMPCTVCNLPQEKKKKKKIVLSTLAYGRSFGYTRTPLIISVCCLSVRPL